MLRKFKNSRKNIWEIFKNVQEVNKCWKKGRKNSKKAEKIENCLKVGKCEKLEKC